MKQFSGPSALILVMTLFSFAAFAQVKVPQKETPKQTAPVKQTPVKTAEVKPVSSGPVQILKVTSNADCNFYVDNELKGTLKQDDILKISLKTGEYQFKAVSLSNPADIKREIYTVDKTGIEKFYNINLQEVVQNRIANEQKSKDPVQTQYTQQSTQSKVLASVPTGSGPAKFFWESTTIDFGSVKKGDENAATKYFHFKNVGSQPLVISECRGSCGCTVPTCPTIPIKAGEEGSITVHYDVNRVGPFTKTITVTSNAENTGETLKITGTVFE